MKRFSFEHDGLTFSYLDSGGRLPVIIALHAHWMESVTFIPLAEALGSEWRVVALDQRGHGYSDHAETYSREEYLGDLDALFDHLRMQEAVLIGNSLGGVNAYQYAARRPERVRALIIEDIGVEVSGDLPSMAGWAGNFRTREDLENQVGQRFAPYLRDSFRESAAGWRLAFEPRDMMLSLACLQGSYWDEWLSTSCPALVIRGANSRVTTSEQIAEMVSRRPNTEMLEITAGHVVHSDDPASFAEAVRSFLRSTPVDSVHLCDYDEANNSMSREQKVAAVEAYLDCFVTKNVSQVPFAEDVTFEGPRMPKLTGRKTIIGILASIMPAVKSIQVKQHIVEGDYVATVFDMETVNGVDHVFDKIHIVDGEIKGVRAFYYPHTQP